MATVSPLANVTSGVLPCLLHSMMGPRKKVIRFGYHCISYKLNLVVEHQTSCAIVPAPECNASKCHQVMSASYKRFLRLLLHLQSSKDLAMS